MEIKLNITIDDKIVNTFKKALTRKGKIVMATVLLFSASFLALYAHNLDNSSFKVFQPGEPISASDFNNNFKALKDESIPVGTILAWHKNLANTTVPLNDHWMECNGAPILDEESPYFNATGETVYVPHLNGEKRFLRGSEQSGVFQNDAMQRIKGKIRGDENGVTDLNGVFSWKETEAGSGLGLDTVNGGLDDYILFDNNANGKYKTNGSGNGDGETRPINMSVVWIIKIK